MKRSGRKVSKVKKSSISKRKLSTKTFKTKKQKKIIKKKLHLKTLKKMSRLSYSGGGYASIIKKTKSIKLKSVTSFLSSNTKLVTDLAGSLEHENNASMWLGFIVEGQYELAKAKDVRAILKQLDIEKFFELKEKIRAKGIDSLAHYIHVGSNFFQKGPNKDWLKKVICDEFNYCEKRKNNIFKKCMEKLLDKGVTLLLVQKLGFNMEALIAGLVLEIIKGYIQNAADSVDSKFSSLCKCPKV